MGDMQIPSGTPATLHPNTSVNGESTAGPIGVMAEYTFSQAPIAHAPAAKSLIGDMIAEFINPMPCLSSKAMNTIHTPFKFDASVNDSLNLPFASDRLDDLLAQIKLNIDPSSSAYTMSEIMITLNQRQTINIADYFIDEINGPNTGIYFNPTLEDSSRGDRLSNGNENGGDLTRTLTWCNAMSKSGVGSQDLLMLTRIINQSTVAVFLAQYALRPDLAPRLKGPNEIEFFPVFNYSRRVWNIFPTGKGLNIEFRGKSNIIQMLDTNYSVTRFRENSFGELEFTINLERTKDNTLEVTNIDKARTRIAASYIDDTILAIAN